VRSPKLLVVLEREDEEENHDEGSIYILRFQKGRSCKLEGGWKKKIWRGRREERRERNCWSKRERKDKGKMRYFPSKNI
jgi:hypothetical protein